MNTPQLIIQHFIAPYLLVKQLNQQQQSGPPLPPAAQALADEAHRVLQSKGSLWQYVEKNYASPETLFTEAMGEAIAGSELLQENISSDETLQQLLRKPPEETLREIDLVAFFHITDPESSALLRKGEGIIKSILKDILPILKFFLEPNFHNHIMEKIQNLTADTIQQIKSDPIFYDLFKEVKLLQLSAVCIPLAQAEQAPDAVVRSLCNQLLESAMYLQEILNSLPNAREAYEPIQTGVFAHLPIPGDLPSNDEGLAEWV